MAIIGLSNTITAVLRPEIETRLVLQLKSGDEKALSELYDRYSGAVFSIILRIVKSQEIAEEVLQETFVKVWKNISSYDDEKGSIYTWIFNVARNLSIDKTRSKEFKNENRTTEVSVSVTNQLRTEIAIDGIGLAAFLDKLRPDYRVIIDMLYFQGYSQKDAADELNIPLGTVKTRCRSALTQLRELLRERGN